tara:strand:+ start:284 stop:622 length:339 start_codon:yes stop_codon:yes gene_type:complete
MKMNTENLMRTIIEEPQTKKQYIENYNGSVSYEREPKFLFSYHEKIAELHNEDHIIIYDKTKRGNNFFSVTTSNHVNKLINICNMLQKEYILLEYNDDGSIKESSEDERRNT